MDWHIFFTNRTSSIIFVCDNHLSPPGFIDTQHARRHFTFNFFYREFYSARNSIFSSNIQINSTDLQFIYPNEFLYPLKYTCTTYIVGTFTNRILPIFLAKFQRHQGQLKTGKSAIVFSQYNLKQRGTLRKHSTYASIVPEIHSTAEVFFKTAVRENANRR